MEEKDSLIAQLQNEVKTRNEELYLAGTYGKQLFEEKAKLSSRIDELLAENEKLEQEKHSLQLDLETQIQTVNSQASELELQREEVDILNEKFKANEKGNDALLKKIANFTKENTYLKKVQDDLTVENSSLKEKISVLMKQINNFEDQAEKSMCETDKDENQELRSQLNVYMLNNKELQNALSQCQCELESVKKNENHLLQLVHELEETVNEKNAEISTYCEEIKKAKEEIEELQGEIELLKYDQIDVNKRGNSVFAELDDRRTMVEKEYKILRKKYELFQKDYETNKKELDRARGQMAILQSMASREYQQTHIDTLEDSLVTARKEISDLMGKLSKALKINEERKAAEQNSSKRNEYDYLSTMLELSQKKEKELQGEIMNLKTQNMYDNEKLIKTQHQLHKTKEDLDNAKREMGNLKLQIKELEQGIMHKLPEPAAAKPRVEIVEGFKAREKSELNKSMFNDFQDFDDIIPGEVELGADGFRQVKPPRKSNKFILKEFNRVEPNSDKSEDSDYSNAKKTKVEERQEPRNDSEKLHCTSERISSKSYRKRNDNCKQQ